MMHVNVRKLKQLHVKVGSVDFPGEKGGGYKIFENFCKVSIMHIIDIQRLGTSVCQGP